MQIKYLDHTPMLTSLASLENYFSPILGVGFTYVSDKSFIGGAIPGLINKLGYNDEWAMRNRLHPII